MRELRADYIMQIFMLFRTALLDQSVFPSRPEPSTVMGLSWAPVRSRDTNGAPAA